MKREAPQAGGKPWLEGVRIWVVEDDLAWRALVLEELESHGASVRGIGSVEALYRELAVDRCDILILDIILPGEDGLSAASHLRRIGDMGIVLVSGRCGAADIARGLAAGADLYLGKPLELPVLVASLHSLYRRLATRIGGGDVAAEPATEAIPDWRLSANGWDLHAPNGCTLTLTAPERTLLRELFAAQGTPVSRTRLIAALTPTPQDFDPHRLEVLMHRLRSRVRAATGLPLPARALRNMGYLLVPGQG